MLECRTVLTGLAACLMAGVFAGCAETRGAGAKKGPTMSYAVQRLAEPIPIDANWDKPVWQQTEAITLTHYMGERPTHFPKTQAKVRYDDEALYVIFRVEDQYVRAVAQKHDDPVCRDSCVEFFFVPGTDPAAGYFNLEMNCGGTMLFHFQRIPRKDSVALDPADLQRIQVATTLPRNVEPEATAPTVWCVEYRLPLDILTKHFPALAQPAPGVRWMANFYKCADDSSHPHWLTWNPVNRPQPDFHVPTDFGRIEFQ